MCSYVHKTFQGTIESLDERLKKQLSDNKHLKSRIQALESDLKLANLDLGETRNYSSNYCTSNSILTGV